MSKKDSGMKLEVKTTNLELTPAISDYVTKKMLDLEKFINVGEDTEVLAEIELGKTTRHHQSGEDIFKAEINLSISGKFHRAASELHDIYAAIDDMKDQIIREIRKEKEKEETLFRKGGRKMKEMIRDIW